jgi:hypothetical protein
MRLKILVSVMIVGCASGCFENPVVDADNAKPVIQAITFIPDTIIAGESCIVKCTAADANNDALSYSWSTIGNVAKVDDVGKSVYYTPNSCCSEPEITLVVRDGRGGVVESTFVVPFKYDD